MMGFKFALTHALYRDRGIIENRMRSNVPVRFIRRLRHTRDYLIAILRCARKYFVISDENVSKDNRVLSVMIHYFRIVY